MFATRILRRRDNIVALISALVLVCASPAAMAGTTSDQSARPAKPLPVTHPRSDVRTGFQEATPYGPTFDIQSDFVMSYGIDNHAAKRIAEWRKHDYVVDLMTGIAWGNYQDYLSGKFDGREHWDEGQVQQNGDDISHGYQIPYMVPTTPFIDYLTDKLKATVDAGVHAIYLEEPEFWVRGGYSPAFKRQWEIFYHQPWEAPDSSVDAQYKASKLKAYLYTRALRRVGSALKDYAKSRYNRDLRFYVATHSLINYTQWRIVSPESRLMDVPCVDGYIAQIWTGTSRSPNIYEGKLKERTFDTALLEYGIMQELVRGTNKRMWFLADPVEDNPRHTWTDYRQNYQKTVVASLLHPKVSRYEVVPWPHRVFNGKYPRNAKHPRGIPASYATELMVVMHTLGRMADAKPVVWPADHRGIGVLIADSAMFQRKFIGQNPVQRIAKQTFANDPSKAKEYADPGHFSSFYGLALPLLKHGAFVRPVQMDNIDRFANYLDDYKVLLLSYAFMKPEHPAVHQALSQWVHQGGVLIYVGDGSDPYNKVHAWWNTGKNHYAGPAQNLFQTLGQPLHPTPGIHKIGNGVFAFMDVHPAAIAMQPKQADALRHLVHAALQARNDPALHWQEKNHFILQRGPYTIAAVLDESVSKKPLTIDGPVVDLFDARLPVLQNVQLKPGQVGFYFNLRRAAHGDGPQLIAAASRIEKFKKDSSGFTFVARGPKKIHAVARWRLNRKPKSVKAVSPADAKVSFDWDPASKTVLIAYPDLPNGIKIRVQQ